MAAAGNSPSRMLGSMGRAGIIWRTKRETIGNIGEKLDNSETLPEN
jgi:hypothetical protein